MKVQQCVKVGCQGWNYEDWVTGAAGGAGVFYPQGTRAADMLEVYGRAFETVEVDSTFYAIPSVSTVEGWANRTPPGFTFSVKLPQEITHQRTLGSGSAALLEEFCERIGRLGPKLAAVLIQLPPQFEMTPENMRALREFLPRLPGGISFAVEFRSRDWMKRAVADMLARQRVALALVEGPWVERSEMLRLTEKLVADFAYVRWMGVRDLTSFSHVQRARDKNLSSWSKVLTRLCEHVPVVYSYFSNFYEGHAPASANKLKRLLGQPVTQASDLEDQPSLF
jgi:uncharacterized protein YecE (DUF72 family)